jgi:cysteinyl-tRNA synthetase
MSKSLGNFFTVRDVLKKFDPEVVRFFILRAHYRSPLNYSDNHLEDAKGALTRLYTALKGTEGSTLIDWNSPYAARFKAAMDDDFNTPEAVAVLFDLAAKVNAGEKALAGEMRALAAILGILQRSADSFFQGGLDPAAIQGMIGAREAARKGKDFAEADRIRKELLAKGVVLEDGPKGTTWRRS